MPKSGPVKIPSIAQMQSTIDKMQDIRGTVLFPRWREVPVVQKAVTKLKGLAKKRAPLLTSKNTDDRVQAKKIWSDMSSCYWDVLFALLEAQIDPQASHSPTSLAFDKTERLFIDFGILADWTLPFYRDLDMSTLMSSRSDGGIFPYLSFSDYIAETWAMLMETPGPVPLAGPEASEREMILQGQLERAQYQRAALLKKIWEEFLPDTPLDLRKLSGDMDNCLLSAMKVFTRVPEYREAEESVRHQIRQERVIYYEAEEAVLLMISSAQKNGVLPPEYAERFIDIQENTKVLAKKLLYSRNDEKKIKRRAKKLAESCTDFSTQMRWHELRSLLVKKKEYLTVPAKHARCDESPFCPTDAPPIDFRASAAELESMSAMDIDMFNVPRVRMYGIPRVIFVPGQGLGTYDWSDNSLLIPVFPSGGASKSLSYALAAYRWDSDEDRHLKNPYEQIKENRKKNLIAMADSFYKDYFLWMTKEKKGYRVLSSETSKTFRQMLAPRSSDD
ncbi:MAG: hypothetical protein K5841_07315 [Fretibacterium sp.]|nr:hypothetical protein [Fretibacterium sp.]